ncbi:hypothetical protein A3J90_06510 [candidate division WOR-1 bacterium RIFOXYC2_FULL_37_10]|uniref:HPr kinase/phosphorylase C-terminal domain-containing protein n=1 Tax=candidate division WOR-1 bacterium RIFOXYB2_FULL_37_13 TaxID=1802579 RepID=A0A1F4SQ81_UNCSA|nr:MAG: hypothetical protein A2310_07440 [candidate division WOR-1 bacterium RIFOXYB2_FULL_37_13]OGC33356.1 MAG: hypothetical protein A3J90_06510 [candidate division WOR-1 bacterium RIFOXYC2_FULL_37_10]
MIKESYYNIHNILKFKLVSEKENWLEFLDRQFKYFSIDIDKEDDMDFEFRLGEMPISLKTDTLKVGKYLVKEGIIYWEDSRKFGKWKIAIKGLNEKKTTIFFDGNDLSCKYLFYQVIEPLFYYKLSLKGYILLHSSCVGDGERAFAFPALLGTGKTSLLLLLLEHGMKEYFSDDFTIFSKEGIVYNYPTPISLFDYNVAKCPFIKKRLTAWERILIARNSWIYKLSAGFAKPPLFANLDSVFPEIQIGNSKPLSAIFLLKTTTNNNFFIKEDVEGSVLIPGLMWINKFEFNSFLNFIEAYSYGNPQKGVFSHWEEFKNNLLGLLKSTKCHEIYIPQKFDYRNKEFLDSLQKIMAK